MFTRICIKYLYWGFQHWQNEMITCLSRPGNLQAYTSTLLFLQLLIFADAAQQY